MDLQRAMGSKTIGIFLLAGILLAGCGGGGGGSQDGNAGNTENSQDYLKRNSYSNEKVTDSDGKVTVDSKSFSQDVKVKVEDQEGNAVKGAVVDYQQNNGIVTVRISSKEEDVPNIIKVVDMNSLEENSPSGVIVGSAVVITAGFAFYTGLEHGDKLYNVFTFSVEHKKESGLFSDTYRMTVGELGQIMPDLASLSLLPLTTAANIYSLGTSSAAKRLTVKGALDLTKWDLASIAIDKAIIPYLSDKTNKLVNRSSRIEVTLYRLPVPYPIMSIKLLDNGGKDSVPTANDEQLTVASGEKAQGELSAYDPDGSALRYSKQSSPQHGSAQVGPTGAFKYVSNENYQGPDSFEFKVEDNSGNSAVGKVNVLVESSTDSGKGGDVAGLVAHYDFSGDAQDQSGRGNHAQVVGAQPTTGPDGQPKTAYAFDGKSNDRIELGVSDLFQADRSFSVHTAFLWQDGPEDYETIFSKNGHYGAGLNAYDDGKLHFDLRQAGRRSETSNNPSENPEAVASIERNQWYEATMVADAQAGEIRLYLNGELAGTDSWDGTVRDVNDPAVLGVRLNAASKQKDFKGKIAETRIYDRALESSEVASLTDPSIQGDGGGSSGNGNVDLQGTRWACSESMTGCNKTGNYYLDFSSSGVEESSFKNGEIVWPYSHDSCEHQPKHRDYSYSEVGLPGTKVEIGESYSFRGPTSHAHTWTILFKSASEISYTANLGTESYTATCRKQ